jgi:bifunctional non-homologous end joining protein LigD
MSLRTASRPARTIFIDPCLPTTAPCPPPGDKWLHEVKQDGYRLMAHRDAGGVRLLTRNGNVWTERYPSIAQAVSTLNCRSCLIDGEAIVTGPNGIAVFEEMRRGARIKPQVQLYVFDLLEVNGKDLRKEPIEARKSALNTLVGHDRDGGGLILSQTIEGDAEFIFEHACRLGYEGIVSKRKGSRYRSGRSRDWIKSKNPEHPAYTRVLEVHWNS